MKKENNLFKLLGSFFLGILSIVIICLFNIFVPKLAPLLFILIPFSIFFGYALLKGKLSKKILIIMIIISIVYLLITSLIIIPVIDMLEVHIPLTFDNFNLVYKTKETKDAILNNALASLVFNIIGNVIVFVIGYGDIKNNNISNNNDNIEFFDPDLY